MPKHMLTKPIVLSVVVNRCYGGFSLSPAAAEAVLKRKGLNYEMVRHWEGAKPSPVLPGHPHMTVEDMCERHDADLVAVVREMGKAANGECADLHVVDFKVEVDLNCFDGKETPRIYGSEA